MRTYPANSPDAVCRLLALAMIVDGHLAPSELRALEHSTILKLVGADPDAFDDAVHALCEDLLGGARCPTGNNVELDTHAIDRLLGEVTDPALRGGLLGAMRAIARADGRLDRREHLLLLRALKTWWSAPARAGGFAAEG